MYACKSTQKQPSVKRRLTLCKKAGDEWGKGGKGGGDGKVKKYRCQPRNSCDGRSLAKF